MQLLVSWYMSFIIEFYIKNPVGENVKL